MREHGFEPGMEGFWKGKKGTCRFCFFDTESSTGTIFESIDFSEDWEDPEFEWYLDSPARDEACDPDGGIKNQRGWVFDLCSVIDCPTFSESVHFLVRRCQSTGPF